MCFTRLSIGTILDERSAAAVAEIQKGWAGFDAGTVNTVVVIVSLAIWVWDGVDGWRRTVRV